MDTPIHQYRWRPPSDSPVKSYCVYLLHGTGEYAGRYERLATALVSAGYEVGAHDHPGHGKSGGERGVVDPKGALAVEALQQIQIFREECNKEPILFGHSLGGVLACELVLRRELQTAGLILSAPAFVPYSSLLDRLKLLLLSILAPTKAIQLPYNAERLTSDKNEQLKAHDDPLIHGHKSASLIGWLFRSGRESLDSASQLNVRTLLLIAGADPVVDSSKTEIFASKAPGTLITKHVYDGLRHEILNEVPAEREKVLADILRWVENLQ